MKAVFLFTVLALSFSQMTWAQDDTKAEGHSPECTSADQSCFKNVNGRPLSRKPEQVVQKDIGKLTGTGTVEAPKEVTPGTSSGTAK